MKRMLFLFLCFSVISVTACSAEMHKVHDEFTGGEILRSNYRGADNEKVKWLSLIKETSKLEVRYSVQFDVTDYDDYVIGDRGSLMNIDGNETLKLAMLNSEKMKSYVQKGKVNKSVTYSLGQEDVDKIFIANRVAFKLTQNNGSQFVYVLPDDVLSEWKRVIATEK